MVGEVVTLHYRDGLVDQKKLHIDVPSICAMGRVEGSDIYVRTTDRFSMRRPDRPDGRRRGVSPFQHATNPPLPRRA